MVDKKLSFVANRSKKAKTSLEVLTEKYGNVALRDADIIVALGGDGLILQTLHETQHLPTPVYGMNRGSVGFLMNEYAEDDLLERLVEAEEAVIHPLKMVAQCADGSQIEALR